MAKKKRTRGRRTQPGTALARAAKWVARVRSTIAALADSVDATRDELAAADSPLRGVLDPDELRTLYGNLCDAICQANILSPENPLRLVIPSALTTAAD